MSTPKESEMVAREQCIAFIERKRDWFADPLDKAKCEAVLGFLRAPALVLSEEEREAVLWAADVSAADSMEQNAKAEANKENRSAHLFYREKYADRAATLRAIASRGKL